MMLVGKGNRIVGIGMKIKGGVWGNGGDKGKINRVKIGGNGAGKRSL